MLTVSMLTAVQQYIKLITKITDLLPYYQEVIRITSVQDCSSKASFSKYLQEMIQTLKAIIFCHVISYILL